MYDSDEGLISDSADFLGRAVIKLQDASTSETPNSIPEPRWHDIKFGVGDSEPACGAILCSFCIVDGDASFDIVDSAVDLHE